MRLERIVLDGFKSFADKTDLLFNSPITAIVGPNGCGKSNIVDAVKWVLGEQSVKSLRSDHMADVIFSGSSSRKALGTAEASLFISNTTGQLPIEASEVQISRRIYKSGESEYRINNKICRLKDIRELFMDTGIGVRAYSIIEQGQVEQLVTASKTDRRNIFEEAAGISKYKAHKKEALRKLERCEQNLLRLADILNEVGKQLRSIKQEKLQQKSIKTEKLQKTIEKLNTECAELEAELDDEKSGIIDIVRLTAQLHNELQSISLYRDNLSHQKSRLTDRAESSEAELERLLTEKAQYKSRLADIKKVLAELEKNLDSKRKEAEQNEAQKAAEQKRLANNKESRSALSSELAVLKDMEQRLEGLKAGVKDILEKSKEPGGDRYNYVEGILADIISANIEYAGAVEAALEGKTDTVVVKNIKSLFSDTETIKKLASRANFVSAESAEPLVDKTDFSKYDCVKGRLVEFVNYESKYAPLVWKLLGKTIIVDTIESAVELSAQTDGGYSFVTLAGEFLGPDGTLRLGPLGKSSGLISRRSRLRQLQEAIGNIDDEISSLEKQLAIYNQTSEHLAKVRKELRTAIYEANTEKMQFASKLSVIEQNTDRLRKEKPLITSEIDQLEEQISRTVQKEYDSKQKLEELEAVNNERSAHIKELEAAHTEQKLQLKSVTEELTDLRIELGQTAERNKALKQSISNIQNQLEQNISAARMAQEEIQSCTEDCKKAAAEILNYESKLTELYVDKETSQQNSRELHERVQKLLDEQKQTEHLIRQLRAEQEQIEQRISELKIELGQLEVKEQNLIERVRDELQIDLVGSYENYEDSEIDWDVVRQEIIDLRAKIERLGNVNLGGKADVILEDSEDVLEAGIEIIAQPPGKEAMSISLLSGGEKSLAAIALLFAVFKTKPSPFCFLDEVDAALDEANNERFNLIIKEFQKNSQFIIITHAKRTMSIADMLYGITMQKRGISEKISVRFDEYEPEEQPAAVA